MVNNRMASPCVLLLLLSLILLLARADDVTLLHDHLSALLNKELGIEHMQTANLKFLEVPVDWNERADEAANTIATMFSTHFDVVRAAEKAVVDSRDSFSPISSPAFLKLGVQQCCRLDESTLEFVKQVGAIGDTRKPCCRYARENTDAIPPVSEILINSMTESRGKFKDLNTLGMKWLYYGDEKGSYTFYPATKDTNGCFVYDPRARPWYAVAASPLPKDIVIVLDMSALTFTRNTSDVIRQAANTVIDTMNEDDRVGVVFFGGAASTPPDCHRHELAYAIPETRRILKDNILGTPRKQGKFFNEGIKKAFMLMDEAVTPVDNSSRKRAILFMTDGHPQETSTQVLQYLNESIRAFSHEILFLTYGVENSELDDDTKSLLENMTTISQNLSGTDRKDRFTILNDSKDLRLEIGRYYKFFAPTSTVKPIVTSPYVDYAGLGLVVSICLPVYYKESGTAVSSLQGVTCVDMTVSDLTLSDLNVQQGYMFIFNRENYRALLHPLLPDPGHVAAYAADPVFLRIDNLEADATAAGIIRRMKDGKNGKEDIETTWTTSRGSSARDGVNTEKILATYYYRTIADTDFTMAIVVPKDDRQVAVSVDDSTNFYPQTVHYCENIWSGDDESKKPPTCQNYGTNATKEFSCVYLAPEAHTAVNDDVIPVSDIQKFLQNDENYNNIGKHFQSGVKEMVAITASLQKIWSNQTSHDVEVLWKYAVTYNGVLRVFPALNIDHDLDYIQSDWFAKALSSDSPGDIVLSTPRYDDFSGRNVVVSLLVNVLESASDRTVNESVAEKRLAVLGMDVSVLTIRGILKQVMPECDAQDRSCFLMDQSGYVIYHDSYISNSSRAQQYVGGMHVTEIEADVASHLIRLGDMEKKNCLSFGIIWRHLTWRMSSAVTSNNEMSSAGYSLHKVPSTNTYLVMKQTSWTSPQASPCVCDTQASAEAGLAVCSHLSTVTCQCPCYTKAENFKRCVNEFTDITHPICTPNQTSLLPSKPKWAQGFMQKANLRDDKPCFDTNCHSFSNKWHCSSFSRCMWCPESSQPCVPADQRQCEKGGGVHVAAVVVPVLLAIALLAMLGIFLYCWRKKERTRKQQEEDDRNRDSIYDDISSQLSDPGTINDSYIHTPQPKEDNAYGFEAPGAPGNHSLSRGLSCVGHTPPGHPPTDFPPGSPEQYLSMPAVHKRPSEIGLKSDYRDKVSTIDSVPDGRAHVIGPSYQRQSMPLPPQPYTSPTESYSRSTSSTLPRQLTLTSPTSGYQFAAPGGGQGVVHPLYGDAPEPPPQRESNTQFPYADIAQIMDPNEQPDDEYLTVNSQANNESPGYLSMHNADSSRHQSPQEDMLFSGPDTDETVISVRL